MLLFAKILKIPLVSASSIISALFKFVAKGMLCTSHSLSRADTSGSWGWAVRITQEDNTVHGAGGYHCADLLVSANGTALHPRDRKPGVLEMSFPVVPVA